MAMQLLRESVERETRSILRTDGQLSVLPKTTELAALQQALNYSGYVTPLIEKQQYLGAGFDPTANTAVSQKGHFHNLELMPVELRQLAGQSSGWQGRTSRRLAYPDRLPVAGIIAPGLSPKSSATRTAAACSPPRRHWSHSRLSWPLPPVLVSLLVRPLLLRVPALNCRAFSKHI